jgi:hypothetical protein
VRRAPEAAPAPRRSTPPAGHERAEAAAPAPAPALGGAVKPVAKPQPQQQPPKKYSFRVVSRCTCATCEGATTYGALHTNTHRVEEVDYFQDMEPTYVRPTIIQKGPAKPQAASRLAVETDPSWVRPPRTRSPKRTPTRSPGVRSSHTLPVATTGGRGRRCLGRGRRPGVVKICTGAEEEGERGRVQPGEHEREQARVGCE